jgi:GDP-L-fucose synthase
LNKKIKIYIAGHKGMVGSAIWRNLESNGYSNLIGMSSDRLDLKNQQKVLDFFFSEKPYVVINSAARVGGILANNEFPYQFLMENLQIQNNLIDAALKTDCQKFIFLGSSCIYPKLAPQPIKEEYLLTSSLEPTNEWYAIAKIAGVKACEAIRKQFGKDYISLMPTNLYGPFDNFDLKTSHVLPAMIRKFHDSKIEGNSPVELWGSGNVRREFLHVDDLASAVVFSLENQLEDGIFNVGTGLDLTIKSLALMIQKIICHQGEIFWDNSKPDGTPRKLLDVSQLKNIGWNSTIDLEQGVRITYDWFLQNQKTFKKVNFK